MRWLCWQKRSLGEKIACVEKKMDAEPFRESLPAARKDASRRTLFGAVLRGALEEIGAAIVRSVLGAIRWIAAALLV
jgi:hypothetical protein